MTWVAEDSQEKKGKKKERSSKMKRGKKTGLQPFTEGSMGGPVDGGPSWRQGAKASAWMHAVISKGGAPNGALEGVRGDKSTLHFGGYNGRLGYLEAGRHAGGSGEGGEGG